MQCQKKEYCKYRNSSSKITVNFVNVFANDFLFLKVQKLDNYLVEKELVQADPQKKCHQILVRGFLEKHGMIDGVFLKIRS